jgi:hypothetical protein
MDAGSIRACSHEQPSDSRKASIPGDVGDCNSRRVYERILTHKVNAHCRVDPRR